MKNAYRSKCNVEADLIVLLLYEYVISTFIEQSFATLMLYIIHI